MKKITFTGIVATCLLNTAPAAAAEMFQLRYNLTGSLGGEIFADPRHSGWLVGTAYTHIDVNRITGDDGKRLTVAVPAGQVPLPAPAPAALYPSYAANVAEVHGQGSLNQINLAIAYTTADDYAGGRMVYGFNIPYAIRKQNFTGIAATPALQFNPLTPQPARQVISSQFNAQYQASLAKQGADQSGEAKDWGDAELQAGWLYATDKLRVLAGLSVVMPTGAYSPAPAPDVGFGNFYTVRPAVQFAYLMTPELALAAKATLGFNGRNKDNDLRSGNWGGLEAAIGYKTAIGVFGLHGIHVSQYQSDTNNPFGDSKLHSTNAGVFFTTKIPVINAAVTLQSVKTTSARNSRSGSYSQIRLIKAL